MNKPGAEGAGSPLTARRALPGCSVKTDISRKGAARRERVRNREQPADSMLEAVAGQGCGEMGWARIVVSGFWFKKKGAGPRFRKSDILFLNTKAELSHANHAGSDSCTD